MAPRSITPSNIHSFCICLIALVVLTAPAQADTDLDGRLMLDYARFEGVHNEFQQAEMLFIRRARLELKHETDEGWQAELEIDFDAETNEIDILDANVEFPLTDDLNLIVGKMKENFGLENTTSSNDIQTMERSVATEIFAPGRNFGASLEGDHALTYWQLGLFQSALDENSNAEYAITGRLVLNPLKSTNQLLHLGVSGTRRNMAGNEYEINEPIDVSQGDSIIESPEYTVDTLQTYALEGAWVYKRFSVQSEYFRQTVTTSGSATEASQEATFSGYYWTFSLFLTDHQRDYKNGSFEGFNTSGGRRGVELVGRYSEVEILKNWPGTYAESMLLTLNYYLSEDVRLMAEASWSDVKASNPNETGDGQALSARIIYQF